VDVGVAGNDDGVVVVVVVEIIIIVCYRLRQHILTESKAVRIFF